MGLIIKGPPSEEAPTIFPMTPAYLIFSDKKLLATSSQLQTAQSHWCFLISQNGDVSLRLCGGAAEVLVRE